jgi:hypothetical protein
MCVPCRCVHSWQGRQVCDECHELHHDCATARPTLIQPTAGRCGGQALTAAAAAAACGFAGRSATACWSQLAAGAAAGHWAHTVGGMGVRGCVCNGWLDDEMQCVVCTTKGLATRRGLYCCSPRGRVLKKVLCFLWQYHESGTRLMLCGCKNRGFANSDACICHQAVLLQESFRFKLVHVVASCWCILLVGEVCPHHLCSMLGLLEVLDWTGGSQGRGDGLRVVRVPSSLHASMPAGSTLLLSQYCVYGPALQMCQQAINMTAFCTANCVAVRGRRAKRLHYSHQVGSVGDGRWLMGRLSRGA